jgi:hypothetical protein
MAAPIVLAQQKGHGRICKMRNILAKLRPLVLNLAINWAVLGGKGNAHKRS